MMTTEIAEHRLNSELFQYVIVDSKKNKHVWYLSHLVKGFESINKHNKFCSTAYTTRAQAYDAGIEWIKSHKPELVAAAKTQIIHETKLSKVDPDRYQDKLFRFYNS